MAFQFCKPTTAMNATRQPPGVVQSLFWLIMAKRLLLLYETTSRVFTTPHTSTFLMSRCNMKAHTSTLVAIHSRSVMLYPPPSPSPPSIGMSFCSMNLGSFFAPFTSAAVNFAVGISVEVDLGMTSFWTMYLSNKMMKMKRKSKPRTHDNIAVMT